MNNIEKKLKFYYHTPKPKEDFNVNSIMEIYKKLADEESKLIFTDRLLFSLTGDWKYMRDILLETGVWNRIYRILNSKKGGQVYIYGAGVSGSRIPLIFPEYNWAGYIDIKKVNAKCNNLPIYGLEKCKELSENSLILISNIIGGIKIKEDLLRQGILSQNIIVYEEATKEIVKKIYFENFLDKGRMNNRTFVDIGAFDGKDTMHFFDWIGNVDANAIIFEADDNNFQTVSENMASYHHVRLYNQGVADNIGTAPFSSGKGEMSNFSSDGDKYIRMTSLDSKISDVEIGYIKMDIEGFEKQALSGAKKIIAQQKPMMGISIYHKKEDIWEIPKLVLDMNPQYKFYLRHYSLGTADTVLYAI